MANILPTDVQDRVWAMYRSRLVLVTGLALIVLAGIAALALVPSYVALYVAAPPVEEERSVSSGGEEVLALERTQQLVRELSEAFDSATSTISVAESSMALRPSGIRITRMTYEPGEVGKLSVSGEGTRETITGYRDALLKSGSFTSVSVPVGALVPAEGGSFTIVVTGDF